MRRPTLAKAGAWLLAAALVAVLAAPAAAAPPRPTAEAPSFFRAVVTWLAAWQPLPPVGPELQAAPAPLGPELDPDGAAATTADGPTATPELGAGADPSG